MFFASSWPYAVFPDPSGLTSRPGDCLKVCKVRKLFCISNSEVSFSRNRPAVPCVCIAHPLSMVPRPCSLFIVHCPLFIAHCSLLIVSYLSSYSFRHSGHRQSLYFCRISIISFLWILTF